MKTFLALQILIDVQLIILPALKIIKRNIKKKKMQKRMNNQRKILKKQNKIKNSNRKMRKKWQQTIN
jgi:hypothetical protein